MPPAPAAGAGARPWQPAIDRSWAAALTFFFTIAWLRRGQDHDHGWAERTAAAGPFLPLAALTLATLTRPYPRWREWLVAAFRVTFTGLVSEKVLTAFYLGGAPTAGWLGAGRDALQMLLGSRAFRIFFLGVAFPLELPAHLAVHTLCLALALAAVPAACTMPLMTHPLTDGRITVLHSLARIPLLGIVPDGYPPCGRQCRCTAALSFFLVFGGWLVPVFLMLRRHCSATAGQQARDLPARPSGQQQQQRRRQQGSRGASGQRGSSSNLRHARFGAAQSITAGEPAGPPLPMPGQEQPVVRVAPPEHSAASWALEWLFLDGAPLQLRIKAWCILAVFCWLAATVLAMLCE